MCRATAGTPLDDAIYPNGVTTAYSYDNLNRLTNLAATKTSTNTPITNFGYQYDATGNRTQKSTLDYTEDYGYDPLYRLTRTDRTNPGATPPNQWTWNYDAVGNRTSAQKDSEATTSSYNEKNQLTGAAGGGKMLWRGTLDEPGIATFSAPTINGQPARMLAGNVFEATLDLPAGANNVTIQAQDGSGNVATKVYSVNVIGVPSSYSYDANGNLSAKTDGADSWTYTWNALNQLTAVSKNALAVGTYLYDPVGRRASKAVGGIVTNWQYDAGDIITEVSGVAVATFVHGPTVDEPLSLDQGGVTFFYHPDVLGSTAAMTNSAGGVARRIDYGPFGTHQSVDQPMHYGFMGREWDLELGLYYFRARYMDPVSGRFLSSDPIGLSGGINLYQFVLGNPINWRDPSGLTPKPGRYRNKNAAAKAGMKTIYNKDARIELCGWVCGTKEHGFMYEPAGNMADPNKRSTDCDPPTKTCSDGSDPAAYYHSHPYGGDPFLDHEFSWDDKMNATTFMGFPGRQAYVVFYDGEMKKHTFFNNTHHDRPLGCVTDPAAHEAPIK